MSLARPHDWPKITEADLEKAAANAYGDWIWGEVIEHASVTTSLLLPTQLETNRKAERMARVLGVGPQAAHKAEVGDTMRFLMYAEPPEVVRDRERVRRNGGKRKLVPRSAEEFQVVRDGQTLKRIVVVPLQNVVLFVGAAEAPVLVGAESEGS